MSDISKFERKIDKLKRNIAFISGGYLKIFIAEYDENLKFSTDYNQHFARYLAFSNLEFATREIDPRLSRKFGQLAKSEKDIVDLLQQNRAKYSARNIGKVTKQSAKIEKNKIFTGLSKMNNILDHSLDGNTTSIQELHSRTEMASQTSLKSINGLEDLALIESEELAKLFTTYPLIVENMKRAIKGQELKQNKKQEEQQIKYKEREYEDGTSAKYDEHVVEQEQQIEKERFYQNFVAINPQNRRTNKLIFSAKESGGYSVNPEAIKVMATLTDEELKQVYDAQMHNITYTDKSGEILVKMTVASVILEKYKSKSGRNKQKEVTEEMKREEQVLLKAIEVVKLKKDINNPRYFEYEQLLEDYQQPIKKTGFWGRK